MITPTPNETMLLLDESLIQSETGLRRVVHPGEKAPFVLEPDEDKPWERCGPGMSRRVQLYGTTLYDDLVGKYRMWYFARMGPHWRIPCGNYQIPGLYVPRTDEKPYNCNGAVTDEYGREFADNDRGDLTCYAESDDGIHWVKPDLGVFTFNESPRNNIVWDFHGASVFIDRGETDPAKRYKAIGFCRRYRNVFLLTSPDGIHWSDKENLEPVARRSNEGTFNVTFDPVDHIYRGYSLARHNDTVARRVISYTESPGLEGPWKELVPCLEPSSWDDEMGRQKYDAIRAEFHNLSGFRYGHMHLGLLGVLYVTAESDPNQENQMPCDGPIDAQLVYSSDGVSWSHADRDRTAVIPRGIGQAFDRGMIIGTAKQPIFQDGRVHWYYTGGEHTHGEPDMEKRVKRIGRVSWQRDRFVALEAIDKGELLTKELHLPRNATGLSVNANAGSGRVEAEICYSDGRTVPGFDRAQCMPCKEDTLDWEPFGTIPDRSALPDTVKIRLHVSHARVYSTTVAGPHEGGTEEWT